MDIRKKVIIDTDIGDDIDDAFAILMAIYSQKFDILGITTVFRNAENRAKIASALLKTTGQNVPVYVGADKPTKGDVIVFPFEEVGKDGKPSIPHYFPNMADEVFEEKSAEDFILESAEKYPHQISIIAIAPFTNLANAIRKNAQSFSKINEIMLMGGERHLKFAEWNVRCDAESAKLTFDSGVKITACGFDITANSALSPSDLQTVRSLQAKPFRLLVEMMEKYISDNKTRIPTMHDPVALCYLLKPELFETEQKRVTVSLEQNSKGKLCETEHGTQKTFICKANISAIIEYMLGLFKTENQRLLNENN